MFSYTHVLLVTDLREDCDKVAARAKYILDCSPQAELAVLHIVEETVLTAGYEIVPIVPMSNEEEIISEARIKMQNLLNQYHIEAEKTHIETALSTRRGILDYCRKNPPDLMVIGRHTRTGLAALFGATADDILPGVNCDVLVVKLGEPV